jgi:uncharacterized protein (TIGR02594 family)
MGAAAPAEARRASREKLFEPAEGARAPRWQAAGEEWMPERSDRRAAAVSRREARRQARQVRKAQELSRRAAQQPSVAGWEASYQPGFEQRFVDPDQTRPPAASQHAVSRRGASRRGSDQVATDTAGFGGGGVVDEARRWIGTNPTNRSSLWCAAFMNFVLQRAGHGGTGSNFAKSFASFGQRVSGPQVGAIAVMSRRGGGHVGVVSGIDASGNPVIISGNSRGRRVAESVYPRGRVYAYVMP